MAATVEQGPSTDDENQTQTSTNRQYASAPVSPQIPAKRKFISPPSRTGQNSPAPKGRSPIVSKSILSDRSITTRKFQSDASLVLVGIRGSGKRSLGFIAATALGRRFITEDHFFQTVTGLSRQDYLRTHGSEEFHRIDIEISRRMLEDNRSGCVIDCGLGSLTSGLQEYLKTYSLTNPVIYLLRDMEPIKQLLKLGERSARLLETGDPSHRRCSNYEYYNLEDNTGFSTTENDGPDRDAPAYSFKLRETQADFSYFVQRVTETETGVEPPSVGSPFSLDVPVDRRLFTHAMEIPLSLYQDGKIRIQELQSGGDVVEIHVDRWRNGAMRCLSRMVAEVRRELRVPILLSANRQLLSDSYVSILKHCLRLAAEFLSVDLYLEPRNVADFMALKGPTRIMGSCILRPSEGKSVWLDGLALAAYDLAVKLKIDIVRLLYVAKSRIDNDDVKHFSYILKQQSAHGPSVIAYNIGPLGRTSQVHNPTLTTVTHKILKQFQPGSAQKPGITAQDAMKALFSSYVLDPLQFCIIGGNVSESLSPKMHNAAYEHLGLNHTYATKNIQSWDDVEKLAKNPNFGGASVVQPWKVRLTDKIAHLSEHARIIGAINTLLPIRANHDGSVPSLEIQASQRNRAGPVVAWFGDNTDWIAMSVCIGRGLSPRNVVQPKSAALVIGAGGMARSAIYALIQMGCRNIFIYNRTRKHAETLAEHYNQWLSTRDQVKGSQSFQVRLLDSTDVAWPADHVMPTIVVSCVTHESLEGNLASNFTMPQQWLRSESGGVVLELAYMTRETPLTEQIKGHRAATGAPWVVVDGLDTLFEQALTQFELMTGRKAPKAHMREAISKSLQEQQTFAADGASYEVT